MILRKSCESLIKTQTNLLVGPLISLIQAHKRRMSRLNSMNPTMINTPSTEENNQKQMDLLEKNDTDTKYTQEMAMNRYPGVESNFT